MEKELLLKCNCQCSVLNISKWEDEKEYYLTFYNYFTSKQNLLSRIKLAFNILRNKNKSHTEIVLTEEDFFKIKNL